MQKQVIFEIAKIREMSFFKTARAALLSVFPFVLIGSFAKVATVALLAPDSFLSGIFGMELSQRFNSLCNGIYAMTGGLSGLLQLIIRPDIRHSFCGKIIKRLRQPDL